MNLTSNFDYLKEHTTINSEYARRARMLQEQIKQLQAYQNKAKPKKQVKIIRLLAVYESFIEENYQKLQEWSI